MARSPELARLFQPPDLPTQRHYEICRAYFPEATPADEIAPRFHLHGGSVRAIVRDLARDPDLNAYFATAQPGRKSSPKREAIHQRACALRRQGATLADIAPVPSNDLASWSQQLRSGVPRAALPANLVLTPMYRTKRVIEDLFRYLPDETMGVLRTGNQSPHAPGQPINPNPHLIHFFAGAWGAGMNSHQIGGTMLVAPQYVRDSAYFKGYYRRPGNRF